MKKNLSNLKWIVSLLILLTFAVGNVRADGNDLSITAPIAADSAAVAQDSAQSTTTWGVKLDEVMDHHRFLFNIITSALAAIIVLFFVFILLRPHIHVKPIVAIQENHKWQFLIKNYGFFPCTNIRIQISKVEFDKNADETEHVITLEDGSDVFFEIRGILQRENDNELLISTKERNDLPPMVRITVLAEHSVSGISTAYSHNFTKADIQRGRYERGEFVPFNSSFPCVLMRKNSMRLRWIRRTIFGVIVIATLLLCFLTNFVWWQIVVACSLMMVTFGMVILIWQLGVHSRVGAHSSRDLIKSIRAIMIMRSDCKPNSLQARAEDADFEETPNPKSRTRVRK